MKLDTNNLVSLIHLCLHLNINMQQGLGKTQNSNALMENGDSFKSTVVRFKNIKWTFIIWSSNSTSRALLKRSKIMSTQRLSVNEPNSVICKSQKPNSRNNSNGHQLLSG